MPTWLFLLLSVVAVGSALLVVLHRNPIKSALALILVMFTLGILYLGLSASFLAVIQIMVYAGAVMVLFLFVLFVLNVGVESPFSTRRVRRMAAGLVGLLTGLILAGIFLVRSIPAGAAGAPELEASFGTIEATGRLLFTEFILPFELLSVLLLVAIIGAVIATRPRWPVGILPQELWPPGDSSEGPSGGDTPEPGASGADPEGVR